PTPDERAGGVVDVESVRAGVLAPHLEVGVVLARAELGSGDARDLLDGRIAEEVKREVDGVDAEIDQRAAAGDRLAGEPRPATGDAAAAHVVGLDVGHPPEVAAVDPALDDADGV